MEAGVEVQQGGAMSTPFSHLPPPHLHLSLPAPPGPGCSTSPAVSKSAVLGWAQLTPSTRSGVASSLLRFFVTSMRDVFLGVATWG